MKRNRKERSVIRNEDDVSGQERVTRDEERRAYFSQPTLQFTKQVISTSELAAYK